MIGEDDRRLGSVRNPLNRQCGTVLGSAGSSLFDASSSTSGIRKDGLCSGTSLRAIQVPTFTVYAHARASTSGVPTTHWLRSLSGVQISTLPTRSSLAALPAAEASASFASYSTIDHTTTPIATSACSRTGNCESNCGGTPSLVLYPRIQIVSK